MQSERDFICKCLQSLRVLSFSLTLCVNVNNNKNSNDQSMRKMKMNFKSNATKLDIHFPNKCLVMIEGGSNAAVLSFKMYSATDT